MFSGIGIFFGILIAMGIAIAIAAYAVFSIFGFKLVMTVIGCFLALYGFIAFCAVMYDLIWRKRNGR